MTRRPSTQELEQPCRGCGHQNAGHTTGNTKNSSRDAERHWPMFDPVWANATGGCAVSGCGCTARS